ncbi:MAG: 30S ribosomal protein S2 [Pseudomonadota bacterium]
MSHVTLRQLFEAGVHYGHSTRYWQPKMAPYIYGAKNKVHIINLDKTLELFQTALSFINRLGARGGKILFVGTKPAARDMVQQYATACGMPYVNHRWLGGTLTNFKTVKLSVRHLLDLSAEQASGSFEKLVKKEALTKQRYLDKLQRSLGGISHMSSLPDAVFVIDVHHEHIAVSEARKLRIPIIGIVDTNSSPDLVDYVIPGNDDAHRAIELYCSRVADTLIQARQAAAQEAAAERAERAERAEQRQAAAAAAEEHGKSGHDKPSSEAGDAK